MPRIQLTEEGKEALSRTVRGQGGFQDLLRRLQQGRDGDIVEVSNEDINRLIRYASKYGPGGFQERLGDIQSE